MPFLQHNVMTCCGQVILVKVLMFMISLCCCFLRHGGDCQRLSEGQGKKRGNLNPRLVYLPFLAALAALGLPLGLETALRRAHFFRFFGILP